MSTTAPRVFISYRREETAGHAGRLYDAMVARFGEGSVFMDIALEAGIDFVERIRQAVGACDVILVMMGPRWATLADDDVRPRLADPEDFVRLEVGTALRRSDVTVIPLLVAGARVPDPDELPGELRALTRRNAFELSDQRWRYDVDRLMSRLEELLGPAAETEGAASAASQAPPRVRPQSVGARQRRWRLVIAIAVGCLALAGIAAAIIAILGGGGSPGTPTPIANLACPSGNCSQPSVTPDGTTLAFIGSNSGPVYVAALDGPRASGSSPVDGAELAIRPNLATTRRLAYRNQRARAIWYTDPAREHPTRLATGFDPSWSPDGSRVVFTAPRSGSNALFTIPVPPHGEAVPLMPYVAGSDSVPAWSPDGKHSAFVRAPSDGCGVRGEVWVVNVDGTGARPLVALSGDERHPTWSPDSQSIGFSSDVADPGNYDLYTVRADGTQRVRRTSDAEDDVGSSWGADGIVYTRGTFNCGGGSNQRLWFLPLSD